MFDRGRFSLDLSRTWKYALICGLASIPLTLGLYWLSGTGNDLSLNTVFFGGLASGWLAHGTGVETDSVGFRAGVIGGLAGLWTLPELLHVVLSAAEPAWFGVLQAGLVVGLFALVLVVAGFTGFLGAMVGNWLAGAFGRRGATVASG